jgi:hypothetical protein
MNWKEFLRPDLIKLVLFIIILAILSIIPVIPLEEPFPCLIPPCPGQTTFNSAYEFLLDALEAPVILTAFATPLTYVVLFAEVIIAYLLSCSISIKLKK